MRIRGRNELHGIFKGAKSDEFEHKPFGSSSSQLGFVPEVITIKDNIAVFETIFKQS